MNVVFTHEVFALQRYGGISRYVAELHRGLRMRGVSSVVSAGFHRNGYLRGLDGIFGTEVPTRLPERAQIRLAQLSGYASDVMLSQLVFRGAITHQSYYNPVLARVQGSPLVVTVYDMIHERFPDHFAGDPTPRRKKYWLQQADLVFAISECTRKDAIDILGLPPEKVLVTHLGIHLPEEKVPPTVLDRPYLLFVGNRDRHKNFLRFARAFAHSRAAAECALAIVGGGPLSAEEQALVQELAIDLRTLPGAERELAAAYAGARALVYPSLYEGFGFPPIEAMAHGCPVACANSGSIPEIVADAGEYFDPLDEESMSAAIDRVVSDDGLRAALVARGYERARKFTWSATVDATLAGYRTLG